MNISDLVDRLIAAGTPASLAAQVVAEAFAAGAVGRQSADHPVDVATEKRRAYDRERQRKVRELRRQSADNPPTVTTPLILTSPPTDSDLPKEVKKVRARPVVLSADWRPPERAYPLAIEFGVTVPQVEAVFRDYLASSGKLYADHDAAFCNFIRNARKFNGNGPGKPTNAGSGIIDAADRALESLRQSEREATDRGSGIGGPPPFRLIS